MLILVSYLLAVLGLIITLVGLPGVWLIFFAIILSATSVGFETLPLWLLTVYFLVSLIASLFDNVAIVLGAKRSGASKWGMIGAILGGIVGFLTGSFIGMFFGPFVGAVLLEIIVEKKETRSAIKAGVGTFLGYLFSVFLKFVVAVIMVSTWLYILNK